MIHVVTIDQYLQQLQQGSEAGLRYFMSKYTKPLRFFAFSILRDKEVAKEIVSDSFFKLWNGRGKVRSEDSVKAFLYIATRNACYNHLASSETKRKSDQALEEDILKGIVAPGADILTSIIHTELVQQVATLVDRLPEQQAKVFRMSFFDDLSTEEICEELGTTAGTVYFARSRALKTLKKAVIRGSIISILIFVSLYCHWFSSRFC